MAVKHRIPITALTVVATSTLLVVSVAIVLWLGFGQAAKSTRQLWAEQSETLIDSMQRGLRFRLQPVRDQALWVARDVQDLTDMAGLDDYMTGVLAATPQVAGIAVIDREGRSRRWIRDSREAISEDWSQREWFVQYMTLVEADDRAAWRDPIFEESIDASTLLHDVPLYDTRGDFIGVFAQIVPIKSLSSFVAKQYTDTGITPFILYDRDFVLAHPLIIASNNQQPLVRLDEFGDVVLERIWNPDEAAPFIQQSLPDTRATGVFFGDNHFLFLYREIETYGPAVWTVGAYLNTKLLSNEQAQGIMQALLAGLVVLVLSVLASVYVGRHISNPIHAMVRSAGLVEAGRLDEITPLRHSHIREFDEAGNAFNNMVRGLGERNLIRDTLGRFVPERVAASLLAGGGQLEVQQTEATILFCDIESFTQLTEALGPVKIVTVLNAYFSAMVDILEQRGGVVTQFQGDAILATFNVPVADPDHVANAVAAAREMLSVVAAQEFEGEKLNIRIGINTGPVVAGAIGARGRLNYTVHGDAVNLAARLEALNKEYGTRLLISAASAARLEDVALRRIGETSVRGQRGANEVFTLADDD